MTEDDRVNQAKVEAMEWAWSEAGWHSDDKWYLDPQ